MKKRDRKKRKFSTRTLKQRKKKLWNLNLCADIWFWQFSFRKKERKKEKFNEKRKKNKKKSYKDRGLLCALLGFSIDVTNVKKKHPYRNFTLIFTRSRSLPEKGKKNYKNFSSYTTDDDFVRERQCWEKKEGKSLFASASTLNSIGRNHFGFCLFRSGRLESCEISLALKYRFGGAHRVSPDRGKEKKEKSSHWFKSKRKKRRKKCCQCFTY